MRANFEAMKKTKRYDDDFLNDKRDRKNKEKTKRKARKDSYDTKRLSYCDTVEGDWDEYDE